jgi:hypothetical protein
MNMRTKALMLPLLLLLGACGGLEPTDSTEGALTEKAAVAQAKASPAEREAARGIPCCLPRQTDPTVFCGANACAEAKSQLCGANGGYCCGVVRCVCTADGCCRANGSVDQCP